MNDYLYIDLDYFYETSVLRREGLKSSSGKLDEYELYKKAIQCISSSLDLNYVLEKLLNLLKDYIPVSQLTLIHHHFSENMFERLGYASLINTPRKKGIPKYLYVKDSVGLVDTTYESGETVIVVNDPKENEVAKAFASHSDLLDQSFIGLPLQHNGNRLGALVCGWHEKGKYTDEHAKLFSLLIEPMALALSNSIRYQEVLDVKNQYLVDNRELAKKLSHIAQDSVVGADAGLKSVMENVHKVASLDSSVLILGETGVGKEVIANAIKNLSGRGDAPFFKIDCGSIPETLIENELFGHEKGAFTGATNQKKGSFELADGGTVFMDEIGELSPTAQVKVLRLLQNRELVRVGGQKVIKLDIRIICATHRNLQEMVTQGLFREDLWYRLNVFPINVPPLRERKKDIPALVFHLISKKVKQMNLDTIPVLSNLELSVLASYDWPGNIRELENVVERWLILGCGAVSFQAILNPSEAEVSETCIATSGFDRMNDPEQIIPIDDLNKKYIESALRICNYKVGGKGGVAERFNIPRSTLRSRMHKLGIRI